jgi:hypothetical protein
MSAAVAILPTDAAIEAAWARYRDLIRAAQDRPELSLDLAHCEATALAWAEWRDLFLARRPK